MKQSLPICVNEVPLIFHCSILNVQSIFPSGIPFYQSKQCHIPRSLNKELQNLPFASSSPLTTKHCDRHMLTVAPIIDLFICLEACCHVTSSNENRNCRCSKVVTSKLATVRETEFRLVSWYVPCVKFSIFLEVATVCETVARESE
jgi:hypothetical protein